MFAALDMALTGVSGAYVQLLIPHVLVLKHKEGWAKEKRGGEFEAPLSICWSQMSGIKCDLSESQPCFQKVQGELRSEDTLQTLQ